MKDEEVVAAMEARIIWFDPSVKEEEMVAATEARIMWFEQVWKMER